MPRQPQPPPQKVTIEPRNLTIEPRNRKPPKVVFCPTKDDQGSGLTSRITYQNADFVAGIRTMFHIRPYEQIEQIEIDSEGVTVRLRIEREPTSVPPSLKRT